MHVAADGRMDDLQGQTLQGESGLEAPTVAQGLSHGLYQNGCRWERKGEGGRKGKANRKVASEELRP